MAEIDIEDDWEFVCVLFLELVSVVLTILLAYLSRLVLFMPGCEMTEQAALTPNIGEQNERSTGLAVILMFQSIIPPRLTHRRLKSSDLPQGDEIHRGTVIDAFEILREVADLN